MQFHRSAFARLGVMAAIVATLWYPPGALLALLCSALLDFPIRVAATFGGRVHAAVGVILWWLIIFLGALAYSAVFLPSWEDESPPPSPL